MTLSSELQDIKDNVSIENLAPKYTSNIIDPNAFFGLGIHNAFDIHYFLNNFEVKIQKIDPTNNSMVFDVIGIDVSIANALRRILLSEVPTMAIEDVTILQNSSILQDEVLCHRLGLIPLKVDPRMFPFVKNGEMDPSNTLIFNLHIECTENKQAKDTDPHHVKYHNSVVYSRHIKWVKQDGQESFGFTNNDIKNMIDPDIIIAKLREGQKIECWMKAIKGTGKEHAKWSPVSTAFYKLLPKIEFTNKKKDFKDKKNQLKLKNLCPKNVFDIEDDEIIVKNNRQCSVCRVCISDDLGFGNKIKLKKVKKHFIFSIESVGQYNVMHLFKHAIKLLHDKCQKLLNQIEILKKKENKFNNNDNNDDNMDDID